MRNHCLVLLLAVAFPFGHSSAQAENVATELDRYLLAVTQERAARSALGNLALETIPSADIELRVWAGYGVSGTSGVVLRRRNGVWSLRQTRFEQCVIIVPSAAGDTLSAAAIERYEALAFSSCRQNPPGEGRWLPFTRVITSAMESSVGLARAWDTLVKAGIDSLPEFRPAARGMRDGHTLVIELRRGSEYRAFEISCNPADDASGAETINRVTAAASASLPMGGRFQCR